MLVYLSFPSRYPLESFDASGEFSLAVTLLLILLLLLKELSGYRKGGGWNMDG